MAATYDNTTAYPLPAVGESTSTFSHIVSGANKYLIVALGQTTGNGITPTSVTYAGTAMTAATVVDDSANGVKLRIYTLIAPTSGTNNVVVTWGISSRGAATAISFSDVDQATPIGTPTTESAGDSSITVSSATNNLVVDFIAYPGGDSVTATVGSGQTERANFIGSPGAGGNSVRAAASTEPGASTVTMSWTRSSGAGSAYYGVSVQAAASGTTATLAWFRA